MYIDTATYWGSEWSFPSNRPKPSPGRWQSPRDERYSGIHDLASTPGEAATPDVIENEQARQRLIAALALFRSHGYSQGENERGTISEASQQLSVALLNALPRHAALPKIAPDGDSGVVMVWEVNDTQLLLTVDEQGLHCVQNAGTPAAVYHDDLYYDGSALPEQLAHVLAF